MGFNFFVRLTIRILLGTEKTMPLKSNKRLIMAIKISLTGR